MYDNKSAIRNKKWQFIPSGLSDYLELIRVNNIFIAIGTMLVAFFLSTYEYSITEMFLVMFAASAILGAGNALNDYFDLTIDIINRPTRVLPSGRIKPSSAKNLSILLFIAGFATAAFISRFHLFLALSAIFLLFLYDFAVKKYTVIGNLIIAGLSAALIIFAAGPYPNKPVILAAIYAFLLHLAREIIKDMQDYAGDIIAGVRSLPIVWGMRHSAFLAVWILSIFLIMLFIPYPLGIFTPIYLYISLLLILPATLFVIVNLLFSSLDERKMAFLSSFVKGIMIVGLLALLLGRKSI